MGQYTVVKTASDDEIAITEVIDNEIRIMINCKEAIWLNKDEAISLLKSIELNIEDFE